MIVGSCFEGDPTELARAQHDVYHEALRVIVSSVYTHARRAAEILDLPADHEPAEARDHRTMQVAHDILAAEWRFQTELSDMFGAKPRQSMYEWLEWLRFECDSWHQTPEIVRLFLMVFENQNNEAGYDAEDALSRQLLRRFHAVPWNDRYATLLAKG